MTRHRVIPWVAAALAAIVVGVPCLLAGAGPMAVLPMALFGAFVFNDSETLLVVAFIPCVVMAALVGRDAPALAVIVVTAAFVATEIASAGARVHRAGSPTVLPAAARELARHGSLAVAGLVIGIVATAGSPPPWLAVTALALAAAGLVLTGAVASVTRRRPR